MKRTIYRYLLRAGLSPKYTGFRYALEAIELYLKINYIAKFNDDIYSKVAEKYQVSSSSVIKGIKNALDSALMRQSECEDFLYLLQNEKSGSIRVSEFSAHASNFIRYETPVE